MTVRDIRLFGDPVLREVCRPVTDFGPGLSRLVTDLTDTCRLPGRAGLAAPQIGVDLRVFCYIVDGGEGYLINPRLVSAEGHQGRPGRMPVDTRPPPAHAEDRARGGHRG